MDKDIVYNTCNTKCVLTDFYVIGKASGQQEAVSR